MLQPFKKTLPTTADRFSLRRRGHRQNHSSVSKGSEQSLSAD
jgi:hypothetical protein